MSKKAIILGAGPAGLVCAWKLLENGWSVDIYEKEKITGGMCRTWKWNDFLVDTGPHIFHTPDERLAEFWEFNFGDLFIKGEFWCKNVKGDKFNEYWDYPLSWESISRYPRHLKQKILNELESLDDLKKAQARNYAEYMEAQVGHTLREMFFMKYPEKIWGLSTYDMTPDWAPKRIEFRKRVTPFYHNQWNAVGKYGAGCVYDRIKEKILALGGKLHLNSDVNKINYKDNYVTGIGFTNNLEIPVEKKDVIISTIPVTLLSSLLGYDSDLHFRGIKTVYLAYKKDSILPKDVHWLYYDSEKVYFNRITEAKKLSPYIAPAKKSYISIEMTFGKGDAIDRLDRGKLIQIIKKQVEAVGLSKAKDVIDSEMNIENFVYPIQYAGYKEELSKTRSVISKFQQLYSLGAGGDFFYADSQILFHKAFDLVEVICGKGSASTQVIKINKGVKLNNPVLINGRAIGNGAKPYIIAEAGLNHNGKLEIAKELVNKAKEAGCDAIKFQTFKPGSRISRKVKAVKYAETIIGLEETLFDMFERLAMGFEQQKELFDYAREKGIEIFSTPFDFESVDFLNSLGVNLFKIASMDLVNIPLIKYVAETGKPLIISTGMSTLGQIEEAVEAVRQVGNPNLMILHCNSSYPAAPEEMNLSVIKSLKHCFKLPVGLSDHTIGLFVSQVALAIGADLIERHFTLDRMLEGPDHILSSDPAEMVKLIAFSKKIPAILGDGIKIIQPSEYDTINMQRKSLYAACNIRKGEIIDKSMIVVKGPGGGLLPKYMDIVIGRQAKRDIESDYPITWENI